MLVTEDGSVEREVKLPLGLRRLTRTTTKTLNQSRATAKASRTHRQHQRVTGSPAFWDCRSVDHFCQTLLATTWAESNTSDLENL